MYLLNKDLCVDTAPDLCQKGDIFLEKKKMEGIFVYILEYMLTLVSLDKMQNIGTLMRKSSKSEVRHFESYSSETGLSPQVKYFY